MPIIGSGQKNFAKNIPLSSSKICPQCGAHYNRDQTAALNIRREGLRILAETK